jgi:hypothetical protein
MQVDSGYRSPAEQEPLYQAYLNGTGVLAAKPGSSNHNHGLAMDVSFSSPAVQQWAHSNAAAFGLSFPLLAQGEPWHIEPLGVRSGEYNPVEYSKGAPPGGVTAPVDDLDSRAAKIEAMILGTPSGLGEAGWSGAGSRPPPPTQQPGQPQVSSAAPAAGGIAGVAQAAYNAGFRGEELITMTAVGMAESGGDPTITNMTYPDNSIGLWQINQLAHKGRFGSNEQLADPSTNATAARALYLESGFKPWSAYTNGAYQQFMGDARNAVAQIGGA